jgi:hypothetical protein
MADTPKLGMPELSASQQGKEVTHNEALRILDALVQATAIDKDSGTPPGSPADGDTYIVGTTSSASGDWDGYDDYIAYYKNTAWLFVAPIEGMRVYLVDESAEYVYLGSAGWTAVEAVVGANSYDVAISKNGKPNASEVLLRLKFTRSVQFSDDFSGSYAFSEVAANASSVFSIKKNGAEVGTITFAASGTTGTFATSGGSVSFAAGDILKIVAPGSQDSTLADIGITLKGLKT